MALVGESGALYRTQIVADSVLTVTIDLIAHCGARVQLVHRASRRVPPDVRAFNEPVRRLMEVADEAAWAVLTRSGRDGLPPSIGVNATSDADNGPVPVEHPSATKGANQYDQPLQAVTDGGLRA
jgi:hypothetical protein